MRYIPMILLILASCTKQELCQEQVEHYTHQQGSDIYKLVATQPAPAPEDYTQGNTQHIFITQQNCK